MGGGDSGGASQQPTSQTVTQSNIPEYVKPYYESTLAQTQALTNINNNPYQLYQGERTAGFAPMQQQAFQQLQGMQIPGQTTDASNLTSGIASQALNYQGYQPGQFQTDRFNDPGMAASYMSPYIQNALDPVMQQMQRTSNLRQRDMSGQAQQAGAYGGYRQGLQLAEEQRNTQKNMGDVYSQGLQSAFGAANQSYLGDRARMQQAQQLAEQSRQFGANMGLQGLNTSLQAAGQLGQLGQQQYTQQMGLNQAQQLAGSQQQALEQQRLNTSYNDFLGQQNWPYKNLSFMSEMIGRPMMNSTTSMYAAPPSQTQSLMGLGIGAYGLSGLLGKKAGGRIRYARGGLAEGGLPEGWDWFNNGPEIKPQQPPLQLGGIGMPQYQMPAPNVYQRPAGLMSLPAAAPASETPPPPMLLGPHVASVEAPAVAPVAVAAPMEPFLAAADSSGADASGAASPGTGASAPGDSSPGDASPGDSDGGGAPGDAGSGEARGGMIRRYADGGGIVSTLNTLGKMPPAYLDRMARQGKYQPFSGIMQQQNRQLQTAAPTPANAALPPMEQGIASTGADPMMGFKDGGIVGYAGGGTTDERYPLRREPFVPSGGSGVVPTSRGTMRDEDVLEPSPLGIAGQGVVDAFGHGLDYLKKGAQYTPLGMTVTGLPEVFNWLTTPKKKVKDVAENRPPRPDSVGTGTDLGWTPMRGAEPEVPAGKSPAKAKREAAQQKAEAMGYTPGDAPRTDNAKTATGLYEELQGLEGLSKENNPLYKRRDELAGSYEREKGRDVYADAIAAGQAILNSPYRGKNSGLAALASGVMAGGTSQLGRDKESLAREERLVALDTALREGDMKKAQHIQDQVQKDEEKRLLAATSIYHTKEGAKASVIGHQISAQAMLDAARIRASAAGSDSKEYRLYQRLEAIQKNIPQQATAAAAKEMGISSLEGLDKDQRALFDQRRSAYEQELFRRAAPMIQGLGEQLGFSKEEIATMTGQGIGTLPAGGSGKWAVVR